MQKEAESTVFQSGEKVETTGTYEVVGVDQTKHGEEHWVRTLNSGEIFPSFEGRAVIWRPVQNTATASG